jgi:hypothetical protein
MSSHPHLVRVGLVVLGLALFPALPLSPSQSGIQVVRNPKTPVAVPGQPSSLTLKQDLVIGLTNEQEGELFAQLQSVGVDDQENIWTLDRKDVKVRIFDKSGRPLIAFGKKGQGPNELQMPFRMFVKGEGIAAILDQGKLAFYSRDGQCAKELSTAKIRSYRAEYDSRGFVYLDSWEMGPDPATKTYKRVWKITKYDPNLNPLKVFRIAEESSSSYDATVFVPTLYFHVANDGRIIWALANASAYDFTVLDQDGRIVRKITNDYEPRKITAADKRSLMKDRFGDQKIPAETKVVIPPAYPPLERFICDDDGRIYGRTTEPDGKRGIRIDIFDPEGRYIARTSLNEEEVPFTVKNDKFYVILPEDEEGRPLVKRYAMIWK